MLGITATEDRAEALRLAREITDIEVPAHYTKGGAFGALGSRTAMFVDELGAALVLMEAPGDHEREPSFTPTSELERQQIEERTYSIRGRDRKVTIVAGFDSSGDRRVEIGTAFVAKDGSAATLMLTMSEARWKTVGEAEFESIVASTGSPLARQEEDSVTSFDAPANSAAGEIEKLRKNMEQLAWAGRYEDASEAARRLLALEEEVFGLEHVEVARTLDDLGSLYRLDGEPERAEAPLQRALGIREGALGPDHPQVATSLNGLGLVYLVEGEYELAEPILRRALAIREQALGPDRPEVAASLSNLAALHLKRSERYPSRSRGDVVRAVSLQQRALAIEEGAFGPEHRAVATSLNNLAEMYQAQGDNERAEPLLRRALGIGEATFGSEHPEVAVTLENLANLYRYQAEYVRAVPLYERALAIRETMLGPEHPDVAASLDELSHLLFLTGEYDRAKSFLLRALAIRERALGPEHTTVATTLNNLAGVYWALGESERAERLLQRAGAIDEKALEAHSPAIALRMSNLASIHAFQGRYQTAEALTQRALAIQEEAFGQQDPITAGSINKLALLHHLQAEPDKAERLYERALAIRVEALGMEHPLVAESHGNLAMLHWERKDYLRAEESFRRATEIEEKQISRLLPSSTEKQARAFMDTLLSTYQVLSFQSVRPADPSTTRLALTTALRRKGRILDAVSGSLYMLRKRLNPGDAALLDAFLARRDALVRRVLHGPGRQSLTEYRSEIEALRREVEEFERAMQRRGGALRAAVKPVLVDDVQVKIPDRAALIEFVAYLMVDAAPGHNAIRWGAPHFGAFVLRRGEPPRWVSLGEARETVELVRKLREALQAPSTPPASVRARARAAYDRVLAPLGPHLDGIEVLLLAPEGSLNLVPFGALVDADDRYVIERFRLAYLTSGRDLLHLALPRAPQSAALVLGAPDYEHEVGAAGVSPGSGDRGASAELSRDFADRRFGPLPGTRREAEAVGTTLGVKALLGDQATEAAVKAVRGPRILHVATHGFFLRDQPAARRDEGPMAVEPFADDGRLGGHAAPASDENPLLRSGLAFAGANRLQGGGEDGILTALEMAGLDLWGTKLVVLSACETGLGDVAVGEGVYGLRRALVIAGAESQLASLWKVDDMATQEMMTAYYRRLARGEGRGEALRQTQLELLQSSRWSHPYYWASFIPIGAWGPLDEPVAAGPQN